MAGILNMLALSGIDLAAGVASFGVVASLWGMGMLLWRLRRGSLSLRVEQRLGLSRRERGEEEKQASQLWRDAKTHSGEAAARPQRFSPMRWARDTCRRAGWEVSPRAFLLGVFAGGALLLVMMIAFTRNLLIASGVFLLALMVLKGYARRRMDRGAALFDRQLIDALGLASRSLRAGHSLGGAFRFISEEVAAPDGPLFGEVIRQQSMGRTMAEAVRKVGDESGNADMRVFTVSILIQLRSGGNLAEVMDRLASVIRERIRIARRLRTLTAQTQLSKRILVWLPVGLFFLLNAINPEYMEPLYTTPRGKFLLGIAVAGILLGAWVMNRMSRLQS